MKSYQSFSYIYAKTFYMLSQKFAGIEIILASASPRRRQLLAGLDIEFEVKTKEVSEDFSDEMPANQVPLYLAQKKAESFEAELQKNQLIIAADTIVSIEGKILNKPNSLQEARTMLEMLSGKMHKVITGVCLLSRQKKELFADITQVYFRSLSNAEIDYYVEHYKPFDKAGSYGAQEWLGMIAIERIEGSYFNVMGLPVHLLYEKLKNF
ncbi:maf: septum formation protein Maf [Raineya orbicola]|uniref:dTTP/UTP pyrophosphatase n=2 Tax=Raineya orbicola TaxID=2016530 RepID=A0A2N3IEB5_9BACT|nr:maf: septum formation protein Maf [Raineya orbicola]